MKLVPLIFLLLTGCASSGPDMDDLFMAHAFGFEPTPDAALTARVQELERDLKALKEVR